MSKLLTHVEGGTPTVADAKLTDIVTTVFSSNQALTGAYGLLQRAAVFVGGMTLQNYRLTGKLNPFAKSGV